VVVPVVAVFVPVAPPRPVTPVPVPAVVITALPVSEVSWMASKSTTDLLKSAIAVPRWCAPAQDPLGLEHEEAGLDTGRELLLLGRQPLLGEIAGGPGAVDPLLVRLHLPRRVAHLRRDLQFEVLQLLLRLLELEGGTGVVGLLRAGADRYETERPKVQVGNALVSTSPSTEPYPLLDTTVRSSVPPPKNEVSGSARRHRRRSTGTTGSR